MAKAKTKAKTKAPVKAKKPKKAPPERTVKDFLATLKDEQLLKDSRALIQMMKRISGCQPKMYNAGTIGFDSYHYKYPTGREGDCAILSFYPRAGKTTIYVMDGTQRHKKHLARLGKHSATRVCLYIKQLGDLQMPVLEQLLKDSFAYLKEQDGHMHRVM